LYCEKIEFGIIFELRGSPFCVPIFEHLRHANRMPRLQKKKKNILRKAKA
jgi:hypothetical protein